MRRDSFGDMNVLFIGNGEETPGLLESLYRQYVPCRVLSAPGAEQGVEIMKAEQVDAVFVDFPLQGPLEAVLELKEGAPEAPIIILAEARAASGAVSALQDKVYDYVVRDGEFRNSLNRLVEITASKHVLKKVRLGNEALYSVLSREILKSKEQWQVTIDAVQDYIFVTDRDRVVKRANLSFAGRFGRHPRGIIGMKADELLGSEAFFEGGAAGKGGAPEGPLTREVSMGEETFTVSVFPARFDDQEVYVYSVKDVTETRRLREQLYHADKLASIGLLVSGVAHEVNNPLTGILGYTEILNNMALDEGTKKYLGKIAAAAERCKSFVAGILGFSRQQTRQRRLENINEVIDKTLQIRAYWARSRNVQIKRHYGELPPAHVDGQQMQQVILNLLLNAEQAIDGGGRQGSIVLSTSYDPGEGKISIKVSDNGQGIPGKQLERIFEPFFTTKPPDTGTGLGLSIARGIIEEHRGTIDVESTEGQGTTFTIKIPVGVPQ
jgi:nitrogen-specific signal transduction histidine kinase